MIYDLMLKISLLIIFSLLGYVSGKLLNLRTFDIASLLVFVISPVVIFVSILHSSATMQYFIYSVYAFIFSSCAALLAYGVARYFWNDARANLFAFAGGTGNTGYFALPIVFSLFDRGQVAMAVFIVIGINLYEFTVGYFLTASGRGSLRESMHKVLRMPVLYAAVLAMMIKASNLTINETLLSFMDNFKGAYSVLGMMVIGISLSTFKKLIIDYRFTSLALVWKHLVLPTAGILLFRYVIPLDPHTLAVVSLMLATPMAGNVVVISSQLDIHPEKAAVSVMLSTILALLCIPVITEFATG